MYQSQDPTPNVAGGEKRLVIRRGEYFFEGFHPVLGLDFVVAVGRYQFVRRDWILPSFERVIQVTKPPFRVAGHRSVFTSVVTHPFSFPPWLASVVVVCLPVSFSLAPHHSLPYGTGLDNGLGSPRSNSPTHD